LKRPKRPKRPKPMFAGFFAISKRPRAPQWDALESEFGPMFTELGTLGRFEKKRALFHRKIREICESGGGKEWLGTQIWSDLLRWDWGP